MPDVPPLVAPGQAGRHALDNPKARMHPLDPWRVANLLIEQHGESAGLQAALRADAFWEAGDEAGAVLWRQVLGATDVLRGTTQRAGEAQH